MIRPARPEDAAAIAAIHVRGWQAAYAGLLPAEFLEGLSIERRTERWRRILETPRPGTLVFEQDGGIAGWVDHGPSRDADRASEVEVLAIYVAPDRWGRGIGSALLQHAEQEIFARGVARITLWVLEQNKPARRFYEKNGYGHDGSRKTEMIADRPAEEIRYAKCRPAEERPPTPGS